MSLFEALGEWVGQPAHFAAGAQRQPDRFGTQHATIAPYGPFEAGDGHTILLAIQNEPEWGRFCENVLRRPDVAGDSRFVSNTQRVAHRDEMNAIIAQHFSELPARELEALLADARIAFAGVKTVAEFLDHPVLAGRDRWREVATEAGGIRALLPPISLGAEPRMDPVPALGEHTAQILAELGRDPQTLEKSIAAQPDPRR